MGEYYIIAAGGTGAMCARSFIYMAAAGCADRNSTYHILLMDKDKESDALTSCENLLADYEAMRGQLGKNGGMNDNIFTFPKIQLHQWNFTQEIVDEYQKQTGLPANNLTNLTLRKLLNPNNEPETALLLSSMYSTEELDTDLNKGFYGHPNIGAPVFDYIRERFLAQRIINYKGETVSNTFMQSLHNSLRNGYAYVYLFGSLFGGTGATVIPNVVLALRSLQDPLNPLDNYGQTRLVLGGSVIMPYFKLPACPSDSVEALEKVKPVDNKFEGQTREALNYYHESGLLSNMMNLMLLGKSTLDITSEAYSRGGSQTQHFHMVLMIAATAANRFFAKRLGGMAEAIPTDGSNSPVTTLGELLMWKMTPTDPKAQGSYQTLLPGELDLEGEYARMATFLRFSVIVNYFMRLKFARVAEELKEEVEVLGTCKQMEREGKRLSPKTLTTRDVMELYKDPVSKAGAICRGFIQFVYDVALSGFDWSKYRVYEKDLEKPTKDEDNRTYYSYKLGPVDSSAVALFNMRWMDFANLGALRTLLDAQSLNFVIDNMTLNGICSFPAMDQDRTGYVEVRYPNSIATVYVDNVLDELGLKKNFFGRMVRDDVWFCEIYERLYSKC